MKRTPLTPLPAKQGEPLSRAVQHFLHFPVTAVIAAISATASLSVMAVIPFRLCFQANPKQSSRYRL